MVGIIAFAILSFVLADMLSSKSSIFNRGNNVGEIAGNDISIQEFQEVSQQRENDYALMTNRQPSEQERPFIRDQAWELLINRYAFQEQYDELGIDVPEEERWDMIQGRNIDPTVQSFFRNPETGQFERDQLIQFLKNFEQQPPVYQNYWNTIKRDLIPGRMRMKYENMLIKSDYVTSAEAERSYHFQNDVAEIRYLVIPYTSVSDSSVTPTDAELKAYLQKHEKEYKTDHVKSLEYVSFPIIPSSADSALVKVEVDNMLGDLRQVKDDSIFAGVNSDATNAFRTYNKNNLPQKLKNMADSLHEGQIYGPFLDFNGYTTYKVSKIMPDTALYKVATIVREIYASDETRDAAARKADLFSSDVSDLASFEATAKKQGIEVIPVKNLKQNDRRVGTMANARQLVQWLFRDADTGDVSDDMEIDEQYVVAVMTGETEEGVQKLEDARATITAKVKKEKKSKIIIDKLKDTSGSLESIASAYGSEANVYSMSDLHMDTEVIPNVGYDPKAVGVAFSLENGKKSAPFAGEDGVLIIELENKTISPEIADYTSFGQQIQQTRTNRTSQMISEAIKDHSDIVDNRYKYY